MGRQLQRLRREAKELESREGKVEVEVKPEAATQVKEEVKKEKGVKEEIKSEMLTQAKEEMEEPQEYEEIQVETVEPPKPWQASSRVLLKLWKIKADLEWSKRQGWFM